MFKFKTIEAAEAVARHCGGRTCTIATVDGELVEVDDSIPTEYWAIKIGWLWFEMTQRVWDRLTPIEKARARDTSQLNTQLLGFEGYRVEVVGEAGSTWRFQVGRSTGWVPCHLSLANARSTGGAPIRRDTVYRSVRPIALKREYVVR